VTSRTLVLALRALVGATLLAAPGWVIASTGDAVAHQHASLGALLAVSAVAGAALLAAAAVGWVRRDAGRPARRRVLRTVGTVVVLVLGAVLAAATVWLRPFSATQPALDALVSDDAVEVQEAAGWYAFVPQGTEPTTGLVYSPGARVDVRATAAVLRPLAEAGYLVVALKEPLGIALTSVNQPASAIAAFDGVEHWAVGGHSLGGVAASSFAAAHDDVVDGLLLHASYPLGDMRDADLLVTSVSGSQDGLTTPADVESSRADLPASTTFVEVEGAVHAFFADYGPQPGDGEPGVSRAEAQAEIVAASRAALDAVAGD
jgi:hypothetical protein